MPATRPNPAHLNADCVAQLFALTPVQGRIAARLAEGRTVREIAAITGRQEGTIYWHLKRIYRRLRLSGQADLVRLVLTRGSPGQPERQGKERSDGEQASINVAAVLVEIKETLGKIGQLQEQQTALLQEINSRLGRVS